MPSTATADRDAVNQRKARLTIDSPAPVRSNGSVPGIRFAMLSRMCWNTPAAACSHEEERIADKRTRAQAGSYPDESVHGRVYVCVCVSE